MVTKELMNSICTTSNSGRRLSLQTGSCKRSNSKEQRKIYSSGDTMWGSLLYSALLERREEIANQIQQHDRKTDHSMLILMRLKANVL